MVPGVRSVLGVEMQEGPGQCDPVRIASGISLGRKLSDMDKRKEWHMGVYGHAAANNGNGQKRTGGNEMSQYFAIVVAAITVGFIASAITDCIKDIHRTEERILIRKESMMKRKIEAKEKRRAEKLQLQKESSQEGKDDGDKESY